MSTGFEHIGRNGHFWGIFGLLAKNNIGSFNSLEPTLLFSPLWVYEGIYRYNIGI